MRLLSRSDLQQCLSMTDTIDAMAEAGDLIIPIKSGLVPESLICAELGEVVQATKTGRESDTQITLFKSVSIAAQDVAAGRDAFLAAQKMGLGMEVDLRA